MFANASIHWIANQQKLFSDILEILGKNKALERESNKSSYKTKSPKFIAIQIPIDSKSMFHTTLQTLAKSPKWSKYFSKSRAFYSLDLRQYYELLSDYGASDIWAWECAYVHILDCLEEVLEWYKGSGLAPYLQTLTKQANAKQTGKILASEFESELKAMLKSKILPAKNGKSY